MYYADVFLPPPVFFAADVSLLPKDESSGGREGRPRRACVHLAPASSHA